MTPEDRITRDQLMDLLEYSPETGIFTWKYRSESLFNAGNHHKAWNTRYSGKKAGSQLINRSGKKYMTLNIFGCKYLAHRLAWLYIYGEYPNVIDHINGDGQDNRIFNLRNVTMSENSRNSKLFSDNKSGITGVNWDVRKNNWQALITAERKTYYLGRFSDFLEACCARKSAEYRLGFHENHGRSHPASPSCYSAGKV